MKPLKKLVNGWQQMPKTTIKVKLTGTDGNIFALTGKVSAALENKGHTDLAKQCCDEVMNTGSYSEALGVLAEYVEVR